MNALQRAQEHVTKARKHFRVVAPVMSEEMRAFYSELLEAVTALAAAQAEADVQELAGDRR